MANYHLSVNPISREKGQSAVACAAYRAAEKIQDERTGKIHDYTRKKGVLKSAIFLPEGAPEHFADRATLWNTVELGEKRKDAQLSREVELSLPNEFSDEQNWALACEFVQREFVSQGMIADVALHRGGSRDNPRSNPHAHVMLTMREVNANGFGLKVRDWNRKDLLLDWRLHWEELCNSRYAELGFDLRIDRRSLEAQGINLEPQNKRGATEAGEKKARFAEHQAIARRNGERIAKDPSIALYAITRQQSTFTEQDIARFVNHHSADSTQFTEIYAKVMVCPELVKLSLDNKLQQRYSTKTMVELEQKMIDTVKTMAAQNAHALTRDALQCATQSSSLHFLDTELSAEQRVALQHITSGQNVACVMGYAGTGKSRLLGVARTLWEDAGYKVHGMSLSGIAAQNLEASSGIQSRTVSSYQWHWQHDRDRLTDKDIVVVDEAGMLGSEQMAAIVAEVHRAEAKLVLVGDTEQLQAISAGAAFRAIGEHCGFVMLTEVKRQKVAWQREATQQLATQGTRVALEAYEKHGYVHAARHRDAAIEMMLETWDEARGETAGENSIMLAYRRADVRDLNSAARALRQECGELGESHRIQTEQGERDMAIGDRVYFLKNDNLNLKVKNGTLGTIKDIHEDALTVHLDGSDKSAGRTVHFKLDEYNNIDLGYAATLHKAQGVTVDRAYVFANRYFDRHLSYVALSRHREEAHLYYAKDEFKDFEQVWRRLSREQSKDISLDYRLQNGDEETMVIPITDNHKSTKATSHDLPVHNKGEAAVSHGLMVDGKKLEKSKTQKGKVSLEDLIEFVQNNRETIEDKQKGWRDKKLQQKSKNQEAAFKAFQEKYEHDHPEKAKMLQESLNNGAKEAKQYQQDFEAYEQRFAKGDISFQEFVQFAESMQTILENEEVMRHLQRYAPNVVHKMTALQQKMQKQLQKSLWRGQEEDQGLHW